MSEYAGMTVNSALGADWVQGSLAQGSDLAAMVTSRFGRLEVARLLAPQAQEGASVTSLDDHGSGIRSADADQIAGRVLESFAEAGVRTVVVEDDLARRGDPGLGAGVAFIGDHVIRWADLGDGVAPAVRLLRTGASGYPLNAFACWRAPAALGLHAGGSLHEGQQVLLVDSTCAVIITVYDAEAFLVLMSRELEMRVK